ncbi:hypothetical protein HDV05_008736, partial [Chytridiales sp. JEL 0842]
MSFAAPAGAGSNPIQSPVDPSKTSLWMGELEPWMDENYIKQLWYSLGENVQVKMIRDRVTGGCAGYCFVDFGNHASASRQLNTMQGSVIPGTNRVFKLNWSSGGGIMDRRESGPEFSIFVGDLAQEVNDAMLLQTFQSRYESCKSAKVVTDPNTGMSRGYGFVRFGSEIDQQRSMAEMQGQFCGSRPMRIAPATPKNKAMGGNMHQGGGGGNGQGSHGGMPGMPMGFNMGMGMNMGMMPPQPGQLNNFYGVPMQGMHGGSGGQGGQGQGQGGPGGFGLQGYNQFNDPTNTTVFIGGLNAAVTDEELRAQFAPFGEIVYTKIPPGKGCGFVQFSHRQSAEIAIQQMNNAVIGGSRVRLSWGKSQAAVKGPSYMNAPPMGGPMGNPSNQP